MKRKLIISLCAIVPVAAMAGLLFPPPIFTAAAVSKAGKPGGSLRPAFSYGMHIKSK